MATVEQVVRALRGVLDPEVGIDVVELGLVYGLAIDGAEVRVRLAMTAPTCPLAEHLAASAERAIALDVPGARAAVEIATDPPWTPAMMSAEARRRLGWDA
jgi:metal-sulfur cluster biosynthetic enzyme